MTPREELEQEIEILTADSSPAARNYRRALRALEVLADNLDEVVEGHACARALSLLRGEQESEQGGSE